MEKVYKRMMSAGSWNIVIGIFFVVVGIAAGIMLMVNGGRLLSSRKEITF